MGFLPTLHNDTQYGGNGGAVCRIWREIDPEFAEHCECGGNRMGRRQ
jgi:hypothetical protein